MNIQAVSNNVLVRWIKEMPKSDTIITPECVGPERSGIRKCEVVSAGSLITKVSTGDTVLVGSWARPWFKYGREDCSVVKEIDLLGVCDG